MDSPKQPPASRRYLLARFKPLAQPKWWIPSSLVILGGSCAWLYFNHPEWLGGALSQSQPQSATPFLEAPAGNLLDDPLEKLALDFPANNLAAPAPNNLPAQSPNTPANPLTSPLGNPLRQDSSEKPPTNNPLDQLTQSPTPSGKPELSRIFTPLIPSFKDAPVPTASDILKQLATPPTASQSPLPPLPVAPILNNPPPAAVQQLPANSGETGAAAQTPLPTGQPASQPQPVAPNYPAYGYGAPVQSPGTTYQPPYSTYGGQPAPISPVPPYYNTQPPAANSQQPYANPNYGYGGQQVAPNQPERANPSQQQTQPQPPPTFASPMFRSF